MPFIGQEPITGGFHKLDAITTSSTNTYNLLLDGGAFSPESANHLMVSLNGVIQSPGSSFTVSGSQITFVPSSGTLSSDDSIDFIMALGNVLDIGTPSDGTVTSGKIATGAVTNAKIASGISSSKLTGALPALDGSALTGAGSMVKLAHTTVASGSAADYPFNFTNVFSSTYDMYYVAFSVVSNQLSGSQSTLYFQMGNGGTYVTASNAVRGAMQYLQLNGSTSVYDGQRYYSTTGIHQTNGTLTSTENGMFSGTAIIANPFDSQFPVNIMTKIIMQYLSTEANSYGEEGYSREDVGDKASYTDFRMGIILNGNASAGDLSSGSARRDSYGHVTVYGLVK